MLNRSELKTVTIAVTDVDTQVGTVVPINMRRYIYRAKFRNTVNAPNIITLGHRQNGAGATTVLDTTGLVVLHQTEYDPDELKEDSAPLYVVEGPASTPTVTPVGNSTVRTLCSAGLTGQLTLWYIDANA